VDGVTLVTLTRGELSATVCPARGADLVSLTLRGVELLHRGTGGAPPGSAAQAALLAPPAQPGAWAGHGQTLFPAVGRHAGGAYAHPATGPRQPAPMPLHGFALALPFAVLPPPPSGSSEPTLVCQLRGPEDLTPQQRAAFPFSFALTITHALGPAGLTVTHAVTSREPGPLARAERRLLPFALGNHISFAVPDFEGARLAGTPSLEFALAPGSLLSGAVAPRAEFGAPGGCALSAPGVLDGVFGGPPGEGGRRCMTLALRAGEGSGGGSGGGSGSALPRAVTVAQRWRLPPSAAGGSSSSGGGEAPACDWAALEEHLFFVLWGEAPPPGSGEAGFLCIEPWLGGPDALNGRCALLDAGETLEWEFEVSAE
jgi:galactose mutarotase-like enzyme